MGNGVKTFVEGELTLEVAEAPGELRVAWRGKSADREPGRFLVPVLAELTQRAKDSGLKLVLDFTALEYMNSSTFTPLVKAVEACRKADVRVALEYALARKWQALSFSALRTFETLDGRVQVLGK